MALFWTPEREDQLIALAAAGETPEGMADALSDEHRTLTASAVRARLNTLSLSVRTPGYWTPQRDAKLRELWAQEPRLTLDAIAKQLGGEREIQAISNRAATLGLPSRYASVDLRHPDRQQAASTVSAKALSIRSPFPGESAVRAVTRTRPRAPAPLETACPFYLGGGHVCGVMVNRRPDEHGNKPSQYCADHRPAVLPISKGALGHIRSAFVRGPARKVRA